MKLNEKEEKAVNKKKKITHDQKTSFHWKVQQEQRR